MTPLRVRKAAEFLLWSRCVGMAGRDLPEEFTPVDLEEGYAIQAVAAELRAMTTVGYKIGLTNAESQQANGVSAPIAGRLASADILKSPARITLPSNHLRIVEAEFVFEMGRSICKEDLPIGEGNIRDYIRAVHSGIEICNSRLSAEDAPLSCVVADNGNADLLVIGDPLVNWRAALDSNIPVVLSRRSGQPVQGSADRVLGSPIKSLIWLANWLASKGERLECGNLVASGSCTGMSEVAPEDCVSAAFGVSAQASVEFTSVGELDEVRA